MSASGCAQHFAQIDFKYSSDAHLSPKARFLNVKAAPDSVARSVAEYIEKNGGVVEKSETNLAFSLEPGAGGEEAWKATRAVFEQEWAAFSKDDPAAYHAIKRDNPLLVIPQVIKRDGPNTGGTWSSATLAQRMGTRRRGTQVPFGYVTWQEREELKTRLHVYVWPAADGGTLVHARALPFLPKYGVEAAPGNWVAYDLWTNTTGAAEAQIVLDLFEYLAAHATSAEHSHGSGSPSNPKLSAAAR